MGFIVKINNEAYLTDCEEGDPPRTLLKENAKVFSNQAEAAIAVTRAIMTHPFRMVNYKVEKIEENERDNT